MNEYVRILLLLALTSVPLLNFLPSSPLSKDISTSQETAIRYEGAVAEVFRENCVACHNHIARKGELVLETYETLMAGGRGGAIVVPGKPDESLLLKMIDGSLQPRMPPGQPLEARQINLIRRWVAAGARHNPAFARASVADDRSSQPPAAALRPAAPVRPSATSLAFRPDGAMLAVGRYRNVDLVNPGDGKLLVQLAGHSSQVRAVAFSPDGSRLIAAGGNPAEFGEYKIWDVATRKELLGVRGHSDSVFAIAISPDGSRLATASYDRLVKVWDTTSGAEIATLKEHTDAVFAVSFSPDGKRLASASADRTVKVWDATSWERVMTIADAADGLITLAFHPEGRYLAASGGDRVIRIWELGDREARPVRSMIGHEDAINLILFSPDGKLLASTGADRLIKLWDPAKLVETATIELQPDWVFALAFNPDGKRLIAGRSDGSLATYDVLTGKRSSAK